MNGNTGRQPGERWTDETNARLVALRGQGLEWPAIAAEFPGRTPQACAQQYHHIHRRLRRASSPDATPAARRSRAQIVAETRQAPIDPASLPPPRPFGDPPPGRSALDKRNGAGA